MRFATALTLMALLGAAGCFKPPEYVKAPPSQTIQVKPNLEGARASTGGASATVTPQLATELLVSTLPEPLKNWTADKPAESKLPIPLPDGTRAEYTRVDREYRKDKDASRYIRISLTDTRGIPALTLFLQSYEAYDSDVGYRRPASLPDSTAWLTYTFGPNKEMDGTGSVTALHRNRFLIQVDGGAGIGSQELLDYLGAFKLNYLK